MVSGLSGPALVASRAALSAALADQTNDAATTEDALEPGEVQEVDMQAQADGIRTVFSDPTNFNVKVCFPAAFVRIRDDCLFSTPFIHLGLFGSTRLLPKAEIYPKRQFLLSHRLLVPLRLPVSWRPRGGWRISNVLSVSIA